MRKRKTGVIRDRDDYQDRDQDRVSDKSSSGGKNISTEPFGKQLKI